MEPKKQENDGFFSEDVLKNAEEIVAEEGGPATHGTEDPATQPMPAYTPEQRQKQSRLFATGVFDALAATLDIFDVGASLEDDEVAILGEVWGDVLQHHAQILEGKKYADYAKATAVTASLAKQKSGQIRNVIQSAKQGETDDNRKADANDKPSRDRTDKGA